jgi:hypothetical protein
VSTDRIGDQHTFVLRALPPICGRSKSIPNGALGSFRSFFRALIYALIVRKSSSVG